MSIASILRALKAALPVILVNVPVVIDAAKQVKKAVKQSKKPKEPNAGAAADAAA